MQLGNNNNNDEMMAMMMVIVTIVKYIIIVSGIFLEKSQGGSKLRLVKIAGAVDLEEYLGVVYRNYCLGYALQFLFSGLISLEIN